MGINGLLVWALSLQIAAAAPPARFEVVSIKASRPGDGRTSISSSPSGLYSAVNMPLRLLIRNAFGLQLDSLLAPLPEWAGSARFDIHARAENARPTIDERRQMLQSLLAERFGLKTHVESREVEGYALVAARTGSFGPKLERVSQAQCDALLARITRKETAPADPAGRPIYGMRLQGSTLHLGCMPARSLVTHLISHPDVNRPIVDRTGLDGNVNLELSWSSGKDGDAGPSIFAALQEQLGLRLEPGRVSAEILIVDDIEPPSLD